MPKINDVMAFTEEDSGVIAVVMSFEQMSKTVWESVLLASLLGVLGYFVGIFIGAEVYRLCTYKCKG